MKCHTELESMWAFFWEKTQVKSKIWYLPGQIIWLPEHQWGWCLIVRINLYFKFTSIYRGLNIMWIGYNVNLSFSLLSLEFIGLVSQGSSPPSLCCSAAHSCVPVTSWTLLQESSHISTLFEDPMIPFQDLRTFDHFNLETNVHETFLTVLKSLRFLVAVYQCHVTCWMWSPRNLLTYFHMFKNMIHVQTLLIMVSQKWSCILTVEKPQTPPQRSFERDHWDFLAYLIKFANHKL
jgi:hypothetical protein